MSISSFAEWLSTREWAGDFAGSALVYPAVLATHLICIGLFGGMILLTNLRLLGWSLKNYSISDVVGRFRPWKRIGFVVMVTCGFLLAGSEAEQVCSQSLLLDQNGPSGPHRRAWFSISSQRLPEHGGTRSRSRNPAAGKTGSCALADPVGQRGLHGTDDRVLGSANKLTSSLR